MKDTKDEKTVEFLDVNSARAKWRIVQLELQADYWYSFDALELQRENKILLFTSDGNWSFELEANNKGELAVTYETKLSPDYSY